MEFISHLEKNNSPDTASFPGKLIPPGDDSWGREHDLPPQRFDLWTRTNVGENLPFPITPLTETNFSTLFNLSADEPQQGKDASQITRRLYGRLYINEGAMVHSFAEEFGLPASLLDRTWGSRRRGDQQRSEKFRPLRLLRKVLSMLFRKPAKKSPMPKHTPEQFFAQVDTWVNDFLQNDLSEPDDRMLWSLGLPIWQERGKYAFATNLRISIPSAYAYQMLERLVKWWTGRKETAHELVTALPGIYSAEIGPALWRMAQSLHDAGLSNLPQDPTRALADLRMQPSPFLEQLDQFLQRHGHRCPNELELLNPRWIEAPEQILTLITHYLQAGNEANPIAIEERQQQSHVEALAGIDKKLDPLRRAILHTVLKWAQRSVTVRDNSRYTMAKFYFPMRKLYAQLGKRWAARGWLAHQDDIFFLTVAEIEASIEDSTDIEPAVLQERIAKRRLAYDYWFTVIPPDAIAADGTPIVEETSAAVTTRTLKGVAASGGQVRGRARIVQTIEEAMKLRAGDILVTQATDPGWTPIFPLVSGIVLEIGGQLSHGAIVAREYALPAVINVTGAMHAIQDGQIIIVDGTNGTVTLEDVTSISPSPLM